MYGILYNIHNVLYTLSGADSKPSIQYFVCKIDKQIKESKLRILEKENKSDDLTDKMTKGGFVIFGVIGELTDKDLLLFPKGNAGSLLKKAY